MARLSAGAVALADRLLLFQFWFIHPSDPERTPSDPERNTSSKSAGPSDPVMISCYLLRRRTRTILCPQRRAKPTSRAIRPIRPAEFVDEDGPVKAGSV